MAINKGEIMRCKIGDLCVIVRSNFEQNIGCFVIIVGVSKLSTCDWICQTYSVTKTKNKKTLAISERPIGGQFSTNDDSLRPISNDEIMLIKMLQNKIKEIA